MPSTVLGKRKHIAKEQYSITTRAKRRITINEPNDENANPFVTAEPPAEKRLIKKARTTTAPAKHGTFESRVSISSQTFDSCHGVVKNDVEVYEDDENTTHIPTPKTPRHRDALSKKIAVTPRHRILATTLPRTPKTPSTPNTIAVYSHARKLFSRSTDPGRLVGRDNERAELDAFLQTCLMRNSGGCLYVSGPPGTGKSALVDEVVKAHQIHNTARYSVVNCMSVRSAKDLGQKLYEDLDLTRGTGFEYLRSCFTSGDNQNDQLYLVILDEADRLADLDIDLMYSMFEWSMQPDSRLVLLGIANALDLTDRLLPRLKSRNLKPELLPFMPYSASQIAEVLTAKLRTLSDADDQTIPFLHPAAIQFCAKKVAGHTGDLRKAFDICRRAIDLVEQETRIKNVAIASPTKTPLMENVNLSSPASPRSPSKRPAATPTPLYTISTAPKATIAHMAKVTAQVFSNGTTQRLTVLNLQQKAVLCALAALEKRAIEAKSAIFSTPSKHTSSASSVKQLYATYSLLCRRENLFPPLSAGEFRDVVSGLETLSLVTRADGKGSSFSPLTPSRTPGRKNKVGMGMMAASGDDKKVASVVSVRELETALEGIGGELLREMLRGDITV